MLANSLKPIFLILLCFFSAQARSLELQVGDVLLQPLRCWACTLIEEETNSIYSHIGVVLSTSPEVKVAEAFGRVRLIPLSEFAAKTEPGQRMRVLRFQNENLQQLFIERQASLAEIFYTDFDARAYDHDFRWNNFDENGEEKFYCSELLAKLFQAFAGLELPVQRMRFERNREAWASYFRGDIPDGQWGISPADFDRSDIFYSPGEL